MSNLPVDAYLDLVRRSGLVEPERLEKVLVQLAQAGARPADGDALSELLAVAGVVTPWQNRMLMKGLWRGFFLGRYKLLRELGAGGMSSVYLAEHVLLRRRVAIKVLHQKRAANHSHLTRFYRESRSAAALDHPNVVRVHDFDTDGKFHYLVMEFIEGPNLQELVEARGRLDYVTAAEQIAQAAEGLEYAHEQGLIHRDVKPANLLVNPQNVVKITDFGLAQIRNGDGPSLTLDDGSVLGTVDYLAPEQALDSHTIDSSADVYGLGCTFYYLLTGTPPYPTGTMAVRLVKHQTEPAPQIGNVRFDCPETLSQLCVQMMAKSPAARPTAARAAQILRQWIAKQSSQSQQGPSVLDVAGAALRPSDPHRDTVSAQTETGTVIEPRPEIPAPAAKSDSPAPAVESSAAVAASPSYAAEPPSSSVFQSMSVIASAPPTAGDEPARAGGESRSAPHVGGDSCVVGASDAPMMKSPAPTRPESETSSATNLPAAVPAVKKSGKIAVRCRHCGALLHAPASAAGKRAKCPECATIVNVPANLNALTNVNNSPNLNVSASPNNSATPTVVGTSLGAATESAPLSPDPSVLHASPSGVGLPH